MARAAVTRPWRNYENGRVWLISLRSMIGNGDDIEIECNTLKETEFGSVDNR